jgi:hypothetical protein
MEKEKKMKRSGIDVTHTRSYNMLHDALARDRGYIRLAAWLQKEVRCFVELAIPLRISERRDLLVDVRLR